MALMKAAQVSKPHGDFELVEREIPQPGPRQLRIKVEACGICHSDVLVKENLWPGIVYPRVPGHEIAGRVDAVGNAITAWKVGQRVGVGWHGSHCFECEPCRRGDFVLCVNGGVTGISFDGGYAEYLIIGTGSRRCDARRSPRRRGSPLALRGHHSVQFSAQCRGAIRRPGRRAGYWRLRPSGNPIRAEDGISHGSDRTRERQRSSGQEAGCKRLH